MRILQQNHLHGDYSAKNNTKPVHFYFQAPKARAVYLVGDFNQWDPSANAMSRRLDGWWFIEVNLTHGHHQYQFLVDGEPMLDPRATGTTHTRAGDEVSVVAVS